VGRCDSVWRPTLKSRPACRSRWASPGVIDTEFGTVDSRGTGTTLRGAICERYAAKLRGCFAWILIRSAEKLPVVKDRNGSVS
jgi:hypothetical protein